ncbi:MAG: MFS transporter [Candidatus Lokiarchaeota archaeon]|nr:MFS transporter [Candidatus Lokiarchaeota archaeon]
MNETVSSEYKAYPYRWIVLIMYVLIGIVTQIFWLTFAPITDATATHMGVTAFHIEQLTATFLYAYIPINFLASYLIDKWGLRWGVGVGVILTGVFGLLRAFNNTNFLWVLLMQIGIAIGQPFVLNASTKVAATWFTENEKTMATGLGTMSVLLGSIIGMVVSPILFEAYSMNVLLLSYGIFGIGISVLYIMFVRQKPPSPPNPYAEKTKVLMWDGVKKLFLSKDFLILLTCIFIGLGAFNALSTKIESIFDQIPDSETVGFVGGVMILGGIFGAVVLSGLSDKTKKRKPFLLLAMGSAVPLVLLLEFTQNIVIIFILGFIFGFLLVSALPVGLTYGAEITYPVPEETSTGVLMLAGQISGILFVFIVAQWFMVVMSILFLGGTILAIFLKEREHYEL